MDCHSCAVGDLHTIGHPETEKMKAGLCEYCTNAYGDLMDVLLCKIDPNQGATQQQKDVAQWLRNGKTGKCPAFQLARRTRR